MMVSRKLEIEVDIAKMRRLIEGLSHQTTIVDFEEDMMLEAVRARTRLWAVNGEVVGFAYVDEFSNLRFEISDGERSTRLEKEIVEWGVYCVREGNATTGESNTLDAAFFVENVWQIEMLWQHGFVEQTFRTLRYGREVGEGVRTFSFPVGFSWRAVKGEQEIEQLVALHRAAFGTERMTTEMRLAMMQSPGYERALDLVVVGPGGGLAAFCVCSVEEEDGRLVGYTDPVGVHSDFQQRGLGQAIMSAGIRSLVERGVSAVYFGTSSDNVSMQRLGERLGFEVVAEKVWFSRVVD